MLRSFLDPVPQMELGMELSRFNLASSMIDVSDGLSVDLHHLCRESGVGAEIYSDKLPLSSELCHFQKQPSRLALHGGEDYQLLFSVSPRKLSSLLKIQEKYKITCIGKILKGKKIFEVNRQGNKRPLELKGFQHFG